MFVGQTTEHHKCRVVQQTSLVTVSCAAFSNSRSRWFWSANDLGIPVACVAKSSQATAYWSRQTLARIDDEPMICQCPSRRHAG